MDKNLYQYLLILGDNSMILGHRLSELCGHGPTLETDIALTNISLDLFGQVRNYFQYAAGIKGDGTTEDDIAFLRFDREHQNAVLVEQPNTDFAHIIARQFLFDAFHVPLLEQLSNSRDLTIAAIASKAVKESKYHLKFSSEWMKRLGDGTKESHERMQAAVNHLYPFSGELVRETEIERKMKQDGVGADLDIVGEKCNETYRQVFSAASITVSKESQRMTRGKEGVHSEFLGFILSDLQYMQRAYPDMEW